MTLKDWEQRKGEGQSVNDVIGKIYAATSDIPDATVMKTVPSQPRRTSFSPMQPSASR